MKSGVNSKNLFKGNNSNKLNRPSRNKNKDIKDIMMQQHSVNFEDNKNMLKLDLADLRQH